MSPAPAARCLGCGFAWHSPALADGLRALGHCPKCSGELELRDDAAGDRSFEPLLAPFGASGRTAPHLVLGIPRR
jgi:hypothetical protein